MDEETVKDLIKAYLVQHLEVVVKGSDGWVVVELRLNGRLISKDEVKTN